MRIVIIIPTYNERGNIVRLLDALRDVFTTMPHDMNVLVVDDSSPDGTADAVRDVQARLPFVHLITGTKQGLGAAYIRGMRHVMDVLGAAAVLEMDADFSHDPLDVPRLVGALDAGADFVIGSRYVAGGSIPQAWSLSRRLNSRVGNLVARHVAGIPRVRDCTAGFRAIRSSVIRAIDLDDLRVQGYAFQIALLHAAIVGGAKVVELPVHFEDRTVGISKLGLRDIVEFFRNAAWIRFQSSRTFIKFALVGLSGVVVNLAAFSALLGAGLNKFIASPIAIELSIVSNFVGNNYWTFGDRRSQGQTHIRGLKFNAVSFMSLGVSYGVFVLLSHLYPQGSPQLHQVAGIVPATLVNYFLNSYWTFRADELP